MHRRRVLTGLAAIGTTAIISRKALGQAWPTRPVTLVVPYTAGGTTDATARLFAEHLSQVLPTRVVIENRPGAQSNTGSEFVARAAPDGYTLLLAAAGLANNVAFGPKPKFDTTTAFDMIGLIGMSPTVVVVPRELGLKTVAEFVDLTRRKPNEVTLGSGQIDHYAELFKRRAGADYRIVSYRSSPQALVDATAGHIQSVMAFVATALPLLGEKLMPLAVSSRARSSVLTDVPTFAESGYKDSEIESWFGIAAPAGTPQDVLARIAKEIGVFVRNPAMQSHMRKIGIETVPEMSQADFTRFARDDAARWLRIAREFGITAE